MADCGCGGGGGDREMAAADPPYRRVLWLVLVLNAVMFLTEAVAGWLARSVSLQGDALDFLGDAANYGIALYVLAKPLRWRASAALLKGLTMGGFGILVLANTAYRAVTLQMPDAGIMGGVGFLALAANIAAALLLFRFRKGDSNRRSVWLCSRNDALANIAVIAAAGLVAVTGQGWADWLVGLFIAAIALQGSWLICTQARRELREGETAPTCGGRA